MCQWAHQVRCRRSNHPYIRRYYEGPPPPNRRSWVSGAALAVAVLLGGAALAISLITLRHNSNTPTNGATSAEPSSGAPNSGSSEAADRALCSAVAPLIKESTSRSRTFTDLGRTGTPDRDVGIPSYITDTKDVVYHRHQRLGKARTVGPR
jgi:hypothetical protein